VAEIVLENVTIQIPIYDIGASSLRKRILSKTVGGRFETDILERVNDDMRARALEATADGLAQDHLSQ